MIQRDMAVAVTVAVIVAAKMAGMEAFVCERHLNDKSADRPSTRSSNSNVFEDMVQVGGPKLQRLVAEDCEGEFELVMALVRG